MSALQKSLMTSKLPPKSFTRSQLGSGGSCKRGSRNDFTPVTWEKYFDEKRDVRLGQNTFRVYIKGNAGPCLFLVHGGGFSALTWSMLTSMLYEMVECQVIAMDLRGHGDTHTTDDNDLSITTISKDVVDVINEVLPTGTPIVIVGHSLGGSVAVHAALNPEFESLIGIVVIDIVEGTAMGALSSMQSILRGRPQSFSSIEQAIKWSAQSGQVKNMESARVSMPGQIKNMATGLTAVAELDSRIDAHDGPSASQSDSDVATINTSRVEVISENEELEFKVPDAVSGKYGWRIDLRATEPHWSGWFQGLSKLFLSCPVQKLLLLASLDRLDTDMTVAHMQGKFEVHAFEQSRGRCGHTVHEDVPDAVAEVIATYLVRNKFATPKSSFGTPLPCC